MSKRAPVVQDYEVRRINNPDGHWMNRHWDRIVRGMCWVFQRWPLARYFVRAAPEARALLKQGTPVVFACTHQDMADSYNGLARSIPERRFVAMTSTSRDGGIAAMLAESAGYEVVRGSSARRGAAALLKMRSRMRSGASALLVVDGPKAPLGDVKAGVVVLARGVKAQIIPIRTWGAERFCADRTWMKLCFTVPAFPAAIFMGPPIDPNEYDDLRDCQIAISRALADLACKASVWAGGPPVAPFAVVE